MKLLNIAIGINEYQRLKPLPRISSIIPIFSFKYHKFVEMTLLNIHICTLGFDSFFCFRHQDFPMIYVTYSLWLSADK